MAIGIVHPDKLKKNCEAQAGDMLILGKGLGVGVLVQALKKGVLSAFKKEGFAQAVVIGAMKSGAPRVAVG
ncbi:MAG: hypothetical protein ABI536_09155 [Gallionella sp.]